MKRFISLALACLMLVCFVGCDKEEVNYSFKSGEVGFSVHHDADAVIGKLGDPIDLVETPSCGGGAEPDREYTYAGFKFNTVNENGNISVVFDADTCSEWQKNAENEFPVVTLRYGFD